MYFIFLVKDQLLLSVAPDKQETYDKDGEYDPGQDHEQHSVLLQP